MVPYVIYALACDVNNLARRDVAVECIDGEVAAHAVVLNGAEGRLWVATAVVDVFLLAGLHKLQFHVGERFQVEHRRAVVGIDGHTLHGISVVAQPLGKTNTAGRQTNAQVDVLDLAAHDFITDTSPNGIDMALPFRPGYQFTKELLYLCIYFVLHFFVF